MGEHYGTGARAGRIRETASTSWKDPYRVVPGASGAPPRVKLASRPGNRLEALRGRRKGQWSIRINDQWRICFEWPEGSPGPDNVEIVDYHR